jgi:hypothetical protein
MLEEIQKYLKELGFVQEENKYTKMFQKQVGEYIVNGERFVQMQEMEFCLEYLGEGWEGNSETDNKPLTQWKLSINEEDVGEFLVHDIEEFKKTFNA